jgi:cohesin loading factor subunit SCC2
VQINREPPKQLVQACQQIVDCLVETVLRSEEQQQQHQQQQQQQTGQSHRIVACLTTTYLFAKIRPQLLVKHVQTLQPYLNIKCFVQVGN